MKYVGLFLLGVLSIVALGLIFGDVKVSREETNASVERNVIKQTRYGEIEKFEDGDVTCYFYEESYRRDGPKSLSCMKG